MYQKIADEIQNKFYQQNFTNDGQRFVAWYLRNIHLRDMVDFGDVLKYSNNFALASHLVNRVIGLFKDVPCAHKL